MSFSDFLSYTLVQMLKNWLQTPRALRRFINWWPPFLASAIRVDAIAEDWSKISVSMRLRFYNQNYVGTHFGGNLFSMTDPFFMVMLMNRLGNDYVVWDKAGLIEFKAPGRGRVHATLRVDDAMLERVRDGAERQARHFEECSVDVLDESGETVASVVKTVYIRKKRSESVSKQPASH